MKTAYVLALDIGTSSVRAALYDSAGNVLPATMIKNERRLTATDDGGAEIDAGEALAQIETAIDDVLEKSKNLAGEIEYVAASSFWHSLVGVDEKGKPTTNVFGWADTRSREYVAALREKLNENEIHNRTGARFHSSFWTAKLLWIQSEQKSVFRRTAQWLSFSDFVALKLSGAAQTSVSMASATGIFDVRKCVWDEKLTEFLKIETENLPEISADDRNTFQLNSKYQKRWAKLKNARFFPAIGDGAANNIGAGCVQKSKAALMIGTSGAMRVAFAGEPPEKNSRRLMVLPHRPQTNYHRRRTLGRRRFVSLAERQFSPSSRRRPHRRRNRKTPSRPSRLNIPAVSRRRARHRLQRNGERRGSWFENFDRHDRHRASRARIGRISFRGNLRPIKRGLQNSRNHRVRRRSARITGLDANYCQRSGARYVSARRARSLFARRGFARA
jgi:sugar (pentulose or hexulose) kinase